MVSLPEEGSQAESDGLGIGQARDGKLGMLLSGPETQIELRGCGTSLLEVSPVQTQENMVRKNKRDWNRRETDYADGKGSLAQGG